MFEKALHSRISNFLEKFQASDGFLKVKSTDTASSDFIQTIHDVKDIGWKLLDYLRACIRPLI